MVSPLLSDPVRAVRNAAARSLSSLPAGQIGISLKPAFDAALAEYIAAQNVSLDMPGAQLNLAVVHQNTGHPELAESHYLAALKIAKKHDKALRSTSTLFWEDDARSPVLAAMCRHLLAQPFVISLEQSFLFDICLHRMHASSPSSSAAGSLNSEADAQNAMLIRCEAATSSPTAACRGPWRQRDSPPRVPRLCADTAPPLC